MNAVQTNKLSQTVVRGPQKSPEVRRAAVVPSSWKIMGDTTETMANIQKAIENGDL